MHACGIRIQTKGCGGTDLLDGEPGDGSRVSGGWQSRRCERKCGGGDLDGNGERNYDGLTARERKGGFGQLLQASRAHFNGVPDFAIN